MENQSSTLPWLRPRRAQADTAPQPSQRPRGPPIRQASIALGRTGLLPAEIQPTPTPTSPPSAPQALRQTTISPLPLPTQQQPPSQNKISLLLPALASSTEALPRPPSPLQQQESLPPKPATSLTDLPQILPKFTVSPSPPTTPTLKPIVTTRSPTPPISPKVIKPFFPTPPQSPKISFRHASNQQSYNPEPETTILQQELSHKNGIKSTSKGDEEQYKKEHNSETKPVIPQTDMKLTSSPSKNAKNSLLRNDKSIITLSGDNTGALMELSSPRKQHAQKLHFHQIEGQKQMSGNKNGEKNAESKMKPNVALVNSNVQTINNSILYNASYNHRSPGVHISFIGKHKPKETSSS